MVALIILVVVGMATLLLLVVTVAAARALVQTDLNNMLADTVEMDLVVV